ncbi:hypothetical protein [Streptomyces nigra]|uniref:hypothetical protein n=1 Tax=Streptomyces nigra TaxID=1827580 RepID=UPI003813DEE5
MTTPTTNTATAADAGVMSANEALGLADPFTPFGFTPDRFAEICLYRCRDCRVRGPVGRALLGGQMKTSWEDFMATMRRVAISLG